MTTLAEVLAAAPHVLLDFDGPVCSVFGGAVTDSRVAGLLIAALDHDAERLPPEALTSHDPFQILRSASALDLSVRDAIGDRLTAAEIEAVESSPATPGAGDAISALRRAGHTITIVSNNSEAAVSLYLTRHGLSEQITDVVARTSSDPAILKPSPDLLRRAVRARSTTPAACVLIGDSVTDVQAAEAAGMPCIGFANKPGKAEQLASAGAAFVVATMGDVATAARRRPLSAWS